MRGILGRRAKKLARMTYQVNRMLGVGKSKAKRRANKAGRKFVAKKNDEAKATKVSE